MMMMLPPSLPPSFPGTEPRNRAGVPSRIPAGDDGVGDARTC